MLLTARQSDTRTGQWTIRWCQPGVRGGPVGPLRKGIGGGGGGVGGGRRRSKRREEEKGGGGRRRIFYVLGAVWGAWCTACGMGRATRCNARCPARTADRTKVLKGLHVGLAHSHLQPIERDGEPRLVSAVIADELRPLAGVGGRTCGGTENAFWRVPPGRPSPRRAATRRNSTRNTIRGVGCSVR